MMEAGIGDALQDCPGFGLPAVVLGPLKGVSIGTRPRELAFWDNHSHTRRVQVCLASVASDYTSGSGIALDMVSECHFLEALLWAKGPGAADRETWGTREALASFAGQVCPPWPVHGVAWNGHILETGDTRGSACLATWPRVNTPHRGLNTGLEDILLPLPLLLLLIFEVPSISVEGAEAAHASASPC